MLTTSARTPAIGRDDVVAAAGRIAGWVRPVMLGRFETDVVANAEVSLAYECAQHTGSFKARGAANLALFHLAAGSMPAAGVVIASGGNAGLACAWAARTSQTKATVLVPVTAPAFKVAGLRGYGADVHLVGDNYADALAASIPFADERGALLSHAYDHPLIAAGAGTLAAEIVEQHAEIETIMVAVGGGGLFAGTTAAVAGAGVRVVAVEPEGSRSLHAALEARQPVDVDIASVAADSLGASRVSQLALDFAQSPTVTSVLVTDAAIISARQKMWDDRRVVLEHGGATALAALLSGAYRPAVGERVVVVLCGANTDPIDLVNRP